MTTLEPVEVTQADREAAAEFVFGETYQDQILSGYRDYTDIVQAFARHRIATAQALEARVRELEEHLNNTLYIVDEAYREHGTEFTHEEALVFQNARAAALKGTSHE